MKDLLGLSIFVLIIMLLLTGFVSYLLVRDGQTAEAELTFCLVVICIGDILTIGYIIAILIELYCKRCCCCCCRNKNSESIPLL